MRNMMVSSTRWATKNNNAFGEGQEAGWSQLIILSYISVKNQPENNLTGSQRISPDGF